MKIGIHGPNNTNFGDILMMHECKKLAISLKAKEIVTCEKLKYFNSELDLVLDASGFVFSDYRGTHSINMCNAILINQKITKCKWIFLPQSWGPFQLPGLTHAVKRVTKGNTVFARDYYSQNELTNIDVVSKLRSDIVYNYSSIENYDDNCERPMYITVCPSSKLQDDPNYITFIHDFICKSPLPCYLIAGEMRDIEFVQQFGTVLASPDNMSLMQDIIQNGQLTISSRYHVSLFSLLKMKAAYCYGWAPKYQDLEESYDMKISIPVDYNEMLSCSLSKIQNVNNLKRRNCVQWSELQ